MSLVGIIWKRLCSSSSKFRLYVVDMYVELLLCRANYGKERGIPIRCETIRKSRKWQEEI